MPAQPIPSASRAFVGRVTELDALRHAFERGERLVTLWGPGGIGKTSLAREHVQREADGATLFCDLSEARSALDVHAAVASLLALPFAGPEVTRDVTSALIARGPTLLVLDNFEQVADAAGETVGEWIGATAELRVLVTSRERLRLAGERCVEVGPLELPDPDERDPARIASSDAVRLFLERGHAVRGDLAPVDAELAAVVGLVRRVEGIPLAIELCAARLGVLGTRQLLALLAESFDVLRDDRRAAPSRHATLRDAIAWSWDLLAPREQRALAQCSVFRGGFSLEAAAEVLDVARGEERRELAAVEVLQELHVRSLLRAVDVPELPGERRFGLYESVRELAAERLSAEGADAVDEAHARHAAFYGAHAAHLARGTHTAMSLDARRRSALERDNLLAVAERALGPSDGPAQPDAALWALGALEAVAVGCAGIPLDPYVAALEAALTAWKTPSAARGSALLARGTVNVVLGRFDEAEADYQAAASLAEETNEVVLASAATVQRRGLQRMRLQAEPVGVAHAHEVAGSDPRNLALLHASEAVALLRAARLTEARRAAREARLLLANAGDVHHEGIVTALLGHVAIELGALDEAEHENERALALLQQVGERRVEAPLTGNLARIWQARGDLEKATELFQRATEVGSGVTHRWLEGLLLGHVGAFELERGRAEAACGAFEAAVLAFDEVDDAPHRAECEAGAAVAHAMNGAFARAEELLVRAEAERCEVTATTICVVRLRRGLVELARADVEGGSVEVHRAAAARLLAEARALRAPEGIPARDVSATARQAERLLALGLARPERSLRTVTIGPECRWFTVDDGARVDLSRRRGLRLVLAALIEQHFASKEALDVDALFAAGWPGERAQSGSAANRVHVTLSKLRALGLRALIESRDDGVSLCPNVQVRRTAM